MKGKLGKNPIIDESLIGKFVQEARINNCQDSTIKWYVDHVKLSGGIIEKNFLAWDKQDVKKLISVVNSRDYSDWTKFAYALAIKKFFQVIKGFDWRSGKYPKEVEWLKPNSNKIKKEYTVLDKKDIEKMIKSCDNLRDKAFIGVLFESGCRISEMDFRIDDIHWDQHGCIIYVNGKTGQRPVRIVKYSGYLELYLKHRNQASEWVWLTRIKPVRKMKVTGLRKILDRAKSLSKLTKPCHPHNFRHSRATQLSVLGVNEIMMRKIFGWARNSPMPSLYSHLSHKDVDEKIIQISSRTSGRDEPSRTLLSD